MLSILTNQALDFTINMTVGIKKQGLLADRFLVFSSVYNFGYEVVKSQTEQTDL